MHRPHTILIVDDSRFNRLLLLEILNHEYHTLEASDGAEALKVMEENPDISLVLLDIVMPIKDGYDVLREMKASSVLSSIPVIVVTSLANVDNEVKTLDLGAIDLIFKPYDSRVMKQRIKNVLEMKEAENMRLENVMLKRQNQAQIQLKAILDNMNGGVIMTEVSDLLTPIYLSKGFYSMRGIDETSIFNKDFDFMQNVLPEDAELLVKSLRTAAISNEAVELEYRTLRYTGEITWIHMQSIRISYPDSDYPVVISLLYDVTANKSAELQLRYRADHDMLTGIYNRQAFYDRTEKMLQASPNKPYLLVYWNIDHFKIINDLFGTQTGDRILKTIALNFRRLIPGHGTFGRLESDHFVTCFQKGDFELEEFVQRVEQNLIDHHLGYTVNFSIGIYEIDDVTLPISIMCDRANLAHSTIKGNYLKRYAYYDDALRNTMLQEQEIISEMKSALDDGQFKIYLQPVFSLSSESPISAEVLIRWKHPVKGLISPGVFIPLFERTGFIEKLDNYVWEEACKYIESRRKRGLTPLPLSVNISRVNLYDKNLSSNLIDLVRRYNIEPDMLKLEITESAYTENPEQLLTTMTTLQSFGFSVLMDDFGSGYSSLNMLKDVPVDILKIDMRFLGGFETSSRAGNILTSVVRMAKWLGIPVIAEGVETKTQVDYLRSIGCDRIQGYYFSPPLPVEEYERKAVQSKPTRSIVVNEGLVTDDFDLLFSGNQFTSRLYNSSLSGIGIYEFYDDKLEVIRVNDTYYEIMGYSPQTFYLDTGNVIERIYKDDRKLFLDACKRSILEDSAQEIIARRYHFNQTLLWLKMRIRYLGGQDARPLLGITMLDVTKYHEMEEELNHMKMKKSEDVSL